MEAIMARETFYKKDTLSNTAFKQYDFDFESDALMIIHDGTGDIKISWNGQTASDDGDLFPSDGFIVFDNLGKSKVFLKSTVNNDPVRIWAWQGSRP
jgi:hypothetical protein